MVKQGQQLMRPDQRMTIEEYTQEVGISHLTIHVLLSDDLMKRAGEKGSDVPCNNRTDNETWMSTYVPEIMMQSSEWHTTYSAQPKKSRHVKSKTKVMLIACLDTNGWLNCEFVPDGKTVNSLL
ncbi:hypothetical protein NPIL_645101 [Nephila pilipes]|uniref:Uncharacterized protein n=1 Tax=Nephila pilipes TaxID=299642 RepID=A0A8X6QJ52_NEPPI|nr:hypothetical protein NPIL_645101 [Nephila pilipes]